MIKSQQTPEYKLIVSYNSESEHAFQQFKDYIHKSYPNVEIIGNNTPDKSLGLEITIENCDGAGKTVYSVQTKGDIIPNQEQQFRFIDKFMKSASRSYGSHRIPFTQKPLSGQPKAGSLDNMSEQTQEQHQGPRLYTEQEMEQNRQEFGLNPFLLNKWKTSGKQQKLLKAKPVELWTAHSEKLKEYKIVMNYNIESKDIYQEMESYVKTNYPGVEVVGERVPYGTIAIEVTIEKKDGSEMSYYAVRKHEDYVYDKEELVEFVDNFMKHAAQTARLPMYENKYKKEEVEPEESKSKIILLQQQEPQGQVNLENTQKA